MLFYKVEVEIINAEELKAAHCQGDVAEKRVPARVVWGDFARFSCRNSNAFFLENGKKTYVFISSIRKDRFTMGILSRDSLNAVGVAGDFLTLLEARSDKIIAEETTMSCMSSLLRTGGMSEFVEDDEDILKHFSIYDIVRHRNIFDLHENIIPTDVCKKSLIRESDAILCKETLTAEIERIYQIPAKTRKIGHPVHYLIQTDDDNVREKMTVTLLSALYANNRIAGRRYCSLKVDINDWNDNREQYGKLYKSCIGGTVVINARSEDDDESDYRKNGADAMVTLCEIIKKHKNNVLTILCLPRSCEKTKTVLAENLGTVTLIELTEDIVYVDKAKSYLRQLAKSQDISADKTLYKCVSDSGKDWLSADLNGFFDDWYSKKLKTDVYSQYSKFDSVNAREVKQKPKGNAYAELEKMIGLTEAKSVIKNAIDYRKAQKLFKEKGISTEHTAMHMVFTGNPGTAKTTAARLFARIMKDNGLLSIGNLYEVGRADLVGKYVGWTAQIVKQKFKTARGSVLFIDEAYSFVDDRDGMYGNEAINTIVQEMENYREDMVVIFAGYPDKMEQFLQKNPGLRSRIAFHVPFNDYGAEELFQITRLLAETRKFRLLPMLRISCSLFSRKIVNARTSETGGSPAICSKKR